MTGDAPAGQPTHLGRFEVQAKLADGGMATLYLGRQRGGPAGADRPVALKVIKDQYLQNREFVSMFMDEAKIVSRLSHPNVVQIYELGAEKERLFIAMELLMGQSLWNVWQACRERKACLRLDLIAWIGARVGEGLHHAHEITDAEGKSIELVHRDVNASNIFCTYDGQVKLIDFGLVKSTNRVSRTAEGIVKGKIAYLSPEQAMGKAIDRRTDVFALAITLWELTTDRRLFKQPRDIDTLRAIKDAKVPDPTKIVKDYPPKLWEALKRALAKDPADRYPTVEEFVRDLDECSKLEGRTIGPETLSEVMKALFASERERQLAWVNEMSSKTDASTATSVPNPYESPVQLSEMGTGAILPKGTLREIPALLPGVKQTLDLDVEFDDMGGAAATKKEKRDREIDRDLGPASKHKTLELVPEKSDVAEAPASASSSEMVAAPATKGWVLALVAIASAAIVIAIGAWVVSMAK